MSSINIQFKIGAIVCHWLALGLTAHQDQDYLKYEKIMGGKTLNFYASAVFIIKQPHSLARRAKGPFEPEDRELTQFLPRPEFKPITLSFPMHVPGEANHSP